MYRAPCSATLCSLTSPCLCCAGRIPSHSRCSKRFILTLTRGSLRTEQSASPHSYSSHPPAPSGAFPPPVLSSPAPIPTPIPGLPMRGKHGTVMDCRRKLSSNPEVAAAKMPPPHTPATRAWSINQCMCKSWACTFEHNKAANGYISHEFHFT